MKRTCGFTLIELAIVLVIVTILIGGLAMPLSAQIQARRIAETKKMLEEAREAILGYALTHQTSGSPPRPYLPCPDSDGDGREDRPGNECTKQSGWFPWVTLGAAAQDAWGNRLRYTVHADLSSKTNGFHNDSAPPPAHGIKFVQKKTARSSTSPPMCRSCWYRTAQTAGEPAMSTFPLAAPLLRCPPEPAPRKSKTSTPTTATSAVPPPSRATQRASSTISSSGCRSAC